ncbi:MAG TPA: FAD-dependent monooxygenase [Actinophytocola sp.]|uniref:FAD-dependent monooxygenase n=1 Tax=Actinophytocola sp. TaxID=1872138 RepID=UPI002DDD12EF|nr:FAD-dependent monooxygenase [Actinophytocola sp.]HEV2783278.1 FAD-dependent monooxygenase [Actinophytocola sp.]
MDVVVVGAGPVGLWLAAELRLAGVEPVVLERRGELTRESRAVAFHARTAEIFAARGIVDRFVAEGLPLPRAHFALLPTPLDFSRLPTGYPYQLILPQARTEHLLAEWARELDVPIRRGHNVVGVRQDESSATVAVRGPDGAYELSARYVVGCDGGNSIVRIQAGIDFPGTDTGVTAVVSDAQLRDPPTSWGFQVNDRGALLMGPLGTSGLYRVAVLDAARTMVDKREPVTVAELRESIRRIAGTDFGLDAVPWVSRFGNAARQAERYRSGRILLAGDAAHVHPPLGGQGLNTGLQDAMNLGWKLAAEVHGWAPPGLLDTYHAERHPVGLAVLANTLAQLRLVDGSEAAMPLRDLFAFLLTMEPVNRYLAGQVSGLDFAYPSADGDHPLVGQRVPALPGLPEALHAGRPVLLDLADDPKLRNTVTSGWSDRVDVVSTPDPTAPAAVLVRPDGHIAWASGGTTPIEHALTQWFGNPHPECR